VIVWLIALGITCMHSAFGDRLEERTPTAADGTNHAHIPLTHPALAITGYAAVALAGVIAVLWWLRPGDRRRALHVATLVCVAAVVATSLAYPPWFPETLLGLVPAAAAFLKAGPGGS